MIELKDETEIAKVNGENVSVVLTNKRIYSTTGSENSGEMKFIPLSNYDSTALKSSQYIVLLYLGIIIFVYGLFLNSMHNSDAYLYFAIGAVCIAAWWFTRKVGAFIYSSSGVNNIFIGSSASNRKAVVEFLIKVQESYDKYKSSLTAG